jgi:HK97 family phage portal protein
MSVLSRWLGNVIDLKSPFWGVFYGGDNWASRPVSEENALNLSTWWRAVRLYGDVTGAMPLKFYRRDASDNRVEDQEHEIATLIRDPNLSQTPQEFWSAMATGLAVFGNAYAEKIYVGPRIVALNMLPYDTMPDRSRYSDNRLEYRYHDRGKIVWLPADRVFHVRGFMIGRSDLGLSPLGAARQTLSIALATEEAVGRTFSSGLRASGFFQGPRLNPDQRDQFKRTFIDPIVGNDAKQHYGILENGFTFQPVTIPPKDAEMLLSRRFNVEEICRFMGMPPLMVGHSAEGMTAWGTGVESIINMWLTLGYNSFLRYIESAVWKWLINPEDRATHYAEYNRNALLRIDSSARAEFLAKMIQNGQMTPNEGRKQENRSPLDGGDELLINSTMIPLAQAGQRVSRTQPAPGEAIPENDDEE